MSAIKNFLNSLFFRYGILGAREPSYRGCYETQVPKEATELLIEMNRHQDMSER